MNTTPFTEIAREEVATRAFLEPQEKTIKGITLRAISLTSLSQLRRTKNEFLDPRGPEAEMPDPKTGKMVLSKTLADEFAAVYEFAYIHAGEESDVDAAVFNLPLFQKRAHAFGRTIPFEKFDYLIQEITKRLEVIKALEFSVKKKPEEKSGGGPTPPPN